MASSLWKIAGGTVYDPASGVDGEVRDVWIEGDKIVAPSDDPGRRPDKTIDAAGLVVMPGGVDIHSHIAGGMPNAARLLTPEQRRGENVWPRGPHTRSGTMGLVPSTFATGYLYAGLGYTTVFDAAVASLDARHAHHELDDTPCLDKGFFALMGNNHYAMKAIESGDRPRLEAFIAWLLDAAKAYAPKLVNPGGAELWKQTPAARGHGLDDGVPGFDVTPRAILREVAAAANALNLPHPVHIHCNQLGAPGNWTTTQETMRTLDGHRAHLAHVQFHSYGGEDESTLCSRTAELASYVNEHDNLTVDVGQVMFGDAVAMTGDGAAAYYLHRLFGNRWYNCDVECEAGCGVTPIKYRRRSVVNALQWAIGLEWFLLIDDPWKVMLSTDHPNGGSFLNYPHLVALLMSRDLRRETLDRCPREVQERCQLRDLDREYTLSEIAVITRAAPARALGLRQKGTLELGADADVVIYTPNDDRAAMFESPRLVVKGGEIVVDRGEFRVALRGRTFHAAAPYDAGAASDIRSWLEQSYSLRPDHYGMSHDELPRACVIATAS